MVRSGVFLSLLGTTILLVGCATFGSRAGLPPHVRSIAVPVFRNKTLEYGAEEPITAAVASRFLQDGRLRLTDAGSADLLLEGTIVEYEITPASFDRRERVSNATVRTRVLVTVTDRTTGQILLADQPFRTSGAFFEATTPNRRRENDALVRLADDILSRVVEGW